MGEIVLVPPRERRWTSCERFLIDRTIADLRARGLKASYYEWLTVNEVWCSFRLGHRNVIAERDQHLDNRHVQSLHPGHRGAFDERPKFSDSGMGRRRTSRIPNA